LRENVRKLGKVLGCMFLFAILGVDPAQNLEKCKRWLCVPVKAFRLCDSCIVSENKIKDEQVKGYQLNS